MNTSPAIHAGLIDIVELSVVGHGAKRGSENKPHTHLRQATSSVFSEHARIDNETFIVVKMAASQGRSQHSASTLVFSRSANVITLGMQVFCLVHDMMSLF
jgi:hypothetical protein